MIFSDPKLHITPGSFRFMTKKVDEASKKLLRDEDQSVVIIRPKYFFGSSGSVWASDYVKISHEYPHLFEVKTENTQWSVPVKRLCASVLDYTMYFLDTLEKEDVLRVKKKEDDIHKPYETSRVNAML